MFLLQVTQVSEGRRGGRSPTISSCHTDWVELEDPRIGFTCHTWFNEFVVRHVGPKRRNLLGLMKDDFGTVNLIFTKRGLLSTGLGN